MEVVQKSVEWRDFELAATILQRKKRVVVYTLLRLKYCYVSNHDNEIITDKFLGCHSGVDCLVGN